MKRIPRNRVKLDLLNAIDSLARSKGLRIREPTTVDTIFDELRSEFSRRQGNDIFLHGHRVETLFAYVAGALGGCRVIKSEDSGEIYSASETQRIPDFRIVTRDGLQLMVEVKNCHTMDPHEQFELKAEYLNGLREYANEFGCQLYLAIYWSRFKQWTLLTADDLDSSSDRVAISMQQAVPRTRMYLLGDRLICTLPILTLRLICSPDFGHAIGEEGQYSFCAQSSQLFCGRDLVTDPTEQQIAWFLMSNSDWHVSQAPAEFDGPRVAAFSLVFTPPERANPDQEFEIVGSLSGLVSRQFDGATTREGQIVSLSPQAEPATFGVRIPQDFHGKALRLLQLDLRPMGSHVSSS